MLLRDFAIMQIVIYVTGPVRTVKHRRERERERERDRERTTLHHVPSPTGLTRWNIQIIPNMFIEVACHMQTLPPRVEGNKA